MSKKNKGSQGSANASRATGPAGRPAGTTRSSAASRNGRRWLLLASGLAVALIAVVAGWALLSGSTGSGSGATAGGSDGTVVQVRGGHWTNITPDTLASMLEQKDFTLLNVKTPYVGEIAGTDLYIPYDQVAARSTELPTDKSAKIVVYCRSGNESAIAAQTLVDLGYTNIDNLDGGMNAWTASGRSLVQLNRG
jgi:rhodanese-related sulfurtransferase